MFDGSASYPVKAGRKRLHQDVHLCLLTDAVTLSADFQGWGEDKTLWKVTAGTGTGTIRDLVAFRPWSRKEPSE